MYKGHIFRYHGINARNTCRSTSSPYQERYKKNITGKGIINRLEYSKQRKLERSSRAKKKRVCKMARAWRASASLRSVSWPEPISVCREDQQERPHDGLSQQQVDLFRFHVYGFWHVSVIDGPRGQRRPKPQSRQADMLTRILNMATGLYFVSVFSRSG
ncbi:hypothetical protein BD289DRAFT_285870 [Coniella lustricola]|uniref:Uncharacterized protein n=1 Tax=Coniella lustricola TaxID=2025994 RepID=A0A2T3AKF2_9PEZI|nr:hypothetical protein BD289DRAFT_285870 [Coniella lustricola]